MAERPGDPLTPLVYADWLEERGDSRARLLRVWVDRAWRASHASSGFRKLLDDYRRLWREADPDWRRAVASARPWVDAGLAEELVRGYLRYVERRPTQRRGVIAGRATEFHERYASGWLVPYFLKPEMGSKQWFLFVQADLGWVYWFATCGPDWLRRFDVASGDGHAF